MFSIAQTLTSQESKATIYGVVTDRNNQPLEDATVRLMENSRGFLIATSTNSKGEYSIPNIPVGGPYSIAVSFIGLKTHTTKTIFLSDGESKRIDFSLLEGAMRTDEVIVEGDWAEDGETPIAFSDVESSEINRLTHTQDAPLLVRTIPGVFAYSPDGVGNGEAVLYIRGLDQSRVQVNINGIPVNDPESNAVYWSNLGAVGTRAASVQVQRGAGSLSYGGGSIGGSFSIRTRNVSSKPGFDIHGITGTPKLRVYGFSAQSGLLFNNSAGIGYFFDWKTGRGSREGAFYEGANYYGALALYPDDKTSVQLLLHGSPQRHGASNVAPLAFFKIYGYSANPAFNFPLEVLAQPLGAKTLEDSLNLRGDSRLLRDSKYIYLAYNFYHKPQLELHLSRDIDEQSNIKATIFYTVGRGGGAWVYGHNPISSGTYGSRPSATPNLDPNTGVIKSDSAAAYFIANDVLKNAYQRISYNLHRQWGVIGSWKTNPVHDLTLTLGGEYRDSYSDHPTYYTNSLGKPWLQVQSYGYRVNGLLQSKKVFYRRTYQGDMADFGGPARLDVNYWNPFMSYTIGTADGTYNDEYGFWSCRTQEGSLFGRVNLKLLPTFSILGSLQYMIYTYRIFDNMPAYLAIGDLTSTPSDAKEGLHRDGLFYMAGYANQTSAIPSAWYAFKLIDTTLTRGYIQPKLGFNWNLTNACNIFANYARVHRRISTSVLYNGGNPRLDADDEKSDQNEIGIGYKSEMLNARLNAYYMTWENQSAYILDTTNAGEPGYDRSGYRWDLVGLSRNQGIEFQTKVRLDNFLPISGITLYGSFAVMDNRWTKVLDDVKIDRAAQAAGVPQEDANLNGKLDPGEDQNGNGKLDENRRIFDSSVLKLTKTASGSDTAISSVLYYCELENTVRASAPFTTIAYGILYETKHWFVNLSAVKYLHYYAFDGGTYYRADGYFTNDAVPKFIATRWDNTLPAPTIVDLQVGCLLEIDPLYLRLTSQISNVFNSEYLVYVNSSGFYPGASRSFRLNVTVGI